MATIGTRDYSWNTAVAMTETTEPLGICDPVTGKPEIRYLDVFRYHPDFSKDSHPLRSNWKTTGLVSRHIMVKQSTIDYTDAQCTPPVDHGDHVSVVITGTLANLRLGHDLVEWIRLELPRNYHTLSGNADASKLMTELLPTSLVAPVQHESHRVFLHYSLWYSVHGCRIYKLKDVAFRPCSWQFEDDPESCEWIPAPEPDTVFNPDVHHNVSERII